MKHALVYVQCLLLIFATPAIADPILNIGRPSTEINKEYERLMPIATYLAEHLKTEGITGGDVRLDGKNNIEATADLLQAGKIDLIFETPYSSLSLIRKAGAEPLTTIRREGVTEYNSYIFVKKDSTITDLQDLKGKVLVFEDPGSTSAYHLPRAALEKSGLDLIPLASESAQVPADKIGYIFAGSELNTAGWVFFGKVDAGALSNLDWTSQDENPEAFRNRMRVIHETETVPRMLVLARPGLATELKHSVTEVLVHMHESEAGRKALQKYRMNQFYRIERPDAYVDALEQKLKHIGE